MRKLESDIYFNYRFIGAYDNLNSIKTSVVNMQNIADSNHMIHWYHLMNMNTTELLYFDFILADPILVQTIFKYLDTNSKYPQNENVIQH